MALPQADYITVKEYLALDADSDIRYEYADGEIFAMAGASRNHNLIALNTSTSLNTQLCVFTIKQFYIIETRTFNNSIEFINKSIRLDMQSLSLLS